MQETQRLPHALLVTSRVHRVVHSHHGDLGVAAFSSPLNQCFVH